MRIGIIGSGNSGSTAARLLGDARHEVALANSRGPETLATFVGELGTAVERPSSPNAAASSKSLVECHVVGR